MARVVIYLVFFMIFLGVGETLLHIRKSRKIKRGIKNSLAVAALMSAVTGLYFLAQAIFYDPSIYKDFSEFYSKTAVEASRASIVGMANVRSEPVVISDSSDGRSNSFGNIEEEWFDIPVSTLYLMDNVVDEKYGRFVGFSVDEIRTIPDYAKHFPKTIRSDPDGIVWINSDYVSYTLVGESGSETPR